MFKQKEVNTIRSLLKQQTKLMKDDYSVGVYNGLELALSVLEKREPEFKFSEKEPETIEKEEQIQTTGRSMIIRRK